MSARRVRGFAEDCVPVAGAWPVLGISRSGSDEALTRQVSPCRVIDDALTATMVLIHAQSRGTYGAPRVPAELCLGLGVRCDRKRVARRMRYHATRGVFYQRKRRGSRPLLTPHEDPVRRDFTSSWPDWVWCTDTRRITPRVRGRSAAPRSWTCSPPDRGVVHSGDHIRSELVVDAAGDGSLVDAVGQLILAADTRRLRFDHIRRGGARFFQQPRYRTTRASRRTVKLTNGMSRRSTRRRRGRSM